MLMFAVVREVRGNDLLVWDLRAFQNVVVHTNCARCFFVGDRVRILYNGVMALSMPPQITAINIQRMSFCPRC